MSPVLPCERCRQPVELRGQRWTRRRLPERGGRLALVCGGCAADLDDLELRLARGRVQVDRATRRPRPPVQFAPPTTRRRA